MPRQALATHMEKHNKILRQIGCPALYILHRAGNPGMECGPLFTTLHYIKVQAASDSFGASFTAAVPSDSRTLLVQILPEPERDPIAV